MTLSSNGKPLKEIGLKRALEMMRRPGTCLAKMFTGASPEGFAHYVIPGGRVGSATAEKIKQHPYGLRKMDCSPATIKRGDWVPITNGVGHWVFSHTRWPSSSGAARSRRRGRGQSSQSSRARTLGS